MIGRFSCAQQLVSRGRVTQQNSTLSGEAASCNSSVTFNNTAHPPFRIPCTAIANSESNGRFAEDRLVTHNHIRRAFVDKCNARTRGSPHPASTHSPCRGSSDKVFQQVAISFGHSSEMTASGYDRQFLNLNSADAWPGPSAKESRSLGHTETVTGIQRWDAASQVHTPQKCTGCLIARKVVCEKHALHFILISAG